MSGFCNSRRTSWCSWFASSTGVSKYSNIPPQTEVTAHATGFMNHVNTYNLRPRKEVYYGEEEDGIYTPPDYGSEASTEA